MKKEVYAVLLAGGKGTRLWPLSTQNYSKSFVRISDRKPLVMETISRLKGLVEKRSIVIVVDKAQEKILKRFTRGIPKKNILVEPFGRSTASAIGLAAIELNPNAIMAVLPTDALIKDPLKFRKTIKSAIDFVHERDYALLCIGIRPKEASTAYGYIKIKGIRVSGCQGIRKNNNIYFVDKFIEKPSKQKANKLVKNKNYLWNTGMFVFKAKAILEAMKKHAPLLHKELLCIKKSKRFKKYAYSRMKNVSIDYQIMEKVKNLYCVRGNFTWSDLGSWKSAGELLKADKCGNIIFGKAALADTCNSIVYNSKKEKLGLVGLKDMIVAQTENGTLVCSKKDAEKVKELVKHGFNGFGTD